MQPLLRLRAKFRFFRVVVASTALAGMMGLAYSPQTEERLGFAGQQPPAAPQRFVVRSQTNLVLVDVRVWDKSGKPVTGLTQDDFRILEDGVPQKINSFSFENIERLA